MAFFTINKYIVADADVCHGKPVFKGTRIMVWQVLEMLADGSSAAQIYRAFPSLKPTHVKAALQYAASITQTNNVVINTQSSQIPA